MAAEWEAGLNGKTEIMKPTGKTQVQYDRTPLGDASLDTFDVAHCSLSSFRRCSRQAGQARPARQADFELPKKGTARREKLAVSGCVEAEVDLDRTGRFGAIAI